MNRRRRSLLSSGMGGAADAEGWPAPGPGGARGTAPADLRRSARRRARSKRLPLVRGLIRVLLGVEECVSEGVRKTWNVKIKVRLNLRLYCPVGVKDFSPGNTSGCKCANAPWGNRAWPGQGVRHSCTLVLASTGPPKKGAFWDPRWSQNGQDAFCRLDRGPSVPMD